MQATIPVVRGNILHTDKCIIVQQVNCKGVMGAGLAKQILFLYPQVKLAYQQFRQQHLQMNNPNEESLLGYVHFVQVEEKRVIANVFGQVGIKQSKDDQTVYTNEAALLHGINYIKDVAIAQRVSVAIPCKIGCGLAGGSWPMIKKGIEAIFENTTVDVVFYEYR